MPCIVIEAKWCPVAFHGQVTSNYDQVLCFPQNRRQNEELRQLPTVAVFGEEPSAASKEKCEGKAILTTTSKSSFDMTQCLYQSSWKHPQLRAKAFSKGNSSFLRRGTLRKPGQAGHCCRAPVGRYF